MWHFRLSGRVQVGRTVRLPDNTFPRSGPLRCQLCDRSRQFIVSTGLRLDFAWSFLPALLKVRWAAGRGPHPQETQGRLWMRGAWSSTRAETC